MAYCPEPPLSPPDPCDGPEPSDQEWTEWRLEDLDYLVEDDNIIEACDGALRIIGQALRDNKDVDLKAIGAILFGAVEAYATGGELSDFMDDMKAANEPDEPDDPPEEECPQFYDGTGNY